MYILLNDINISIDNLNFTFDIVFYGVIILYSNI